MKLVFYSSSIIYSECVLVALGIRQAMRVLVSCRLWPVRLWQYFTTLSHERHGFRKKKKKFIEHKTFISTLCTTFETFLILRRNERDMIRRHYVLVFMSSTCYSRQLLMRRAFLSTNFRKKKKKKKNEISNFLRTDGQTRRSRT